MNDESVFVSIGGSYSVSEGCMADAAFGEWYHSRPTMRLREFEEYRWPFLALIR